MLDEQEIKKIFLHDVEDIKKIPGDNKELTSLILLRNLLVVPLKRGIINLTKANAETFSEHKFKLKAIYELYSENEKNITEKLKEMET